MGYRGSGCLLRPDTTERMFLDNDAADGGFIGPAVRMCPEDKAKQNLNQGQLIIETTCAWDTMGYILRSNKN